MNFNPGSFTGVIGEMKMLGLAAVVGAVLGAVYDILRALRITVPHRFWAVFAEDFLFVLFSGMVYFLWSVEMLEGELRLYVIIGMMAGFAAYLSTLGRIVTGIFRTAAKITGKIARFATEKLKNLASAKKFLRKIKKSS